MTLVDIRPAREHQRILEDARTKFGTDNGNEDWIHLKADGSEIVVSTYAKPISYLDRDAALVAAIVGSLSSKTNSIATIFTMDIFKPAFGKNMREKTLVNVGRICTLLSLIIAVFLSPLVNLFHGGFQFIQEFTGFFSPGIFVIFIFGLFRKRASAKAALAVAICTLPVSLLLYFQFEQTPFLFRMGISFILLSLVMYVVSVRQKNPDYGKAIEISPGMFVTDKVFNISAVLIITILAFLYYTFW